MEAPTIRPRRSRDIVALGHDPGSPRRERSLHPLARGDREMMTMPRMPKSAPLLLTLIALGWAAAARPAVADSSIGFGLHSWRTVDDLHSEGFGNLRRSGVSYLLSYQYGLVPLLKLELAAEDF